MDLEYGYHEWLMRNMALVVKAVGDANGVFEHTGEFTHHTVRIGYTADMDVMVVYCFIKPEGCNANTR